MLIGKVIVSNGMRSAGAVIKVVGKTRLFTLQRFCSFCILYLLIPELQVFPFFGCVDQSGIWRGSAQYDPEKAAREKLNKLKKLNCFFFAANQATPRVETTTP
jgi:hypothetical protein